MPPGSVYPGAHETPERHETTYAVLESLGLSKRLPLVFPVPETDFDSSSEAEAWRQHRRYLQEEDDGPGSITEMSVIRNVEFSTYVANRDKVTLTCARGPPGEESELPKASDTMRWM